MTVNMHSALFMLNYLISHGWEYPDAEFYTASVLKMNALETKELRGMYDNQY